jgi:hypothetical protein
MFQQFWSTGTRIQEHGTNHDTASGWFVDEENVAFEQTGAVGGWLAGFRDSFASSDTRSSSFSNKRPKSRQVSASGSIDGIDHSSPVKEQALCRLQLHADH